MDLRLLLFVLTAFSLSLSAADFPTPYNTEKEEHPPMSADQAAKSATLPEGFKLEVFASEPQVQQPISIAFDDQERLWVAECYTFAERPLRWDMDLRDRIIVLEDKDKDGKADSRTVFWDQGTRMTSAVPGKGGVWATCAPQLLFIPDADNDLIPDGDPIVMLDGFDAENIGHNIVNGLKWGPDGWLYGRHGITRTSLVGTPGTPDSRRTALNCSIWRFHPETHEFEVFCNGGTNPWGLDWDANGQLFYTNTVIGHLWHAMPGAYYRRMFGAHLNPYVYEVIPHTADHYHWDTGAEKWSDIRGGITNTTSALGGGHAHMGCLIYQGGVWPKQYHGDLFACNLHGRRVNRDHLKREGLGYVATHADDFLLMEDPWFRGLDLITGPDGQVWMNDWSDTGECHDNDAIHRTSGRIYRIVYDGDDKGQPTTKRPTWLTNRNTKDFNHLLNSGDEAKRAMAIRWMSEDHPDKTEFFQSAVTNAPQPLVRLELAAALQRIDENARFPLANALANIKEDADDRQQSLMIWYGIEELVPQNPEMAINLAISSKHPQLTKLIARRLTEDFEAKPESINQLISAATSANQAVADSVLAGIAEGLNGWSRATMPKGWETFTQRFPSSQQQTIRELSLVFGDGRARSELIDIVKNRKAESGARRAALRDLLRQPEKDLLPILKNMVNDKVLSTAAVRGLANYDNKDIPAKLLIFAQQYPVSRSVAIDTLVSRPSYAAALLTAVENGKIPSQAISPLQARQIVNLGDKKLQQQLTTLWGDIRETPAAKKQEIDNWKTLLTPDAIASADPVKGKIAFKQACGACHRLYGEGGVIGPDLTGSDRHSIDYLLENTVNPNDVVPADYRLTVFTLKDGRVISGVVPEENDKTITVQGAAEKVIVNKDAIDNRKTLPNSLMPEGLLKAMSPESVKDLIAYLMTTSPIQE